MKKLKIAGSVLGIILLIVMAFVLGYKTKIGNNDKNNPNNVNNTNNSNKPNNTDKPAKPDNTNKPNKPNKHNNTTAYRIKDYYPFKKNIRMSYAGYGNEYASKEVYVDFIQGNTIQLRDINAGTTTGQILQYKNGELTKVIARGEFYYRDNLTSLKSETAEVILKEPIQVGNTWTLSGGVKRTITGIDVSVNTPLRTYKALEVTTEYPDSVIKDYYALHVGLVKSVFTSGDTEITTSLQKYVDNSPVVQTIKFYYPRMTQTDVEIVSKKKVIYLNTNDEIKDVFEKYFKESFVTESISLISKNTKINSLHLNTQNNRVYIDFSNELVFEMNAGAYVESAILRSITNTLGDYYNVKEVYITIEGRPYSSGHIYLEPDETFTVDYKNVVQIQ